jgi:RsiW-degrading membrane proteinase PrsW (M82 family)
MAGGIILLAFLGGLVPALLWLFFWLLEDRCEPEPKRYIFFSFLGGMLMVPIALFFEQGATTYFTGAALLFVWALIEEVLKFGAAYGIALRSRFFDEPLDAIVYLVTVALGFSAAENALFLWAPLHQGDILRGIVTEDLRFIGATLLHTLASATIGISLALSFYERTSVRKAMALGGVILAILLHGIFNFFILKPGSSNAVLWVFLLVWFGIIALLLLVEKVKRPARDYC